MRRFCRYLSFIIIALMLFSLTGCVRVSNGRMSFGPAEGLVVIKTTPPGALISVDGADGKFSSPSDMRLKEGKHLIKLSLPGYQEVQIEVDVPYNDSVTIDRELAKLTGILQATSTPSGAAITVDGKATGLQTPSDLELSVGNHIINISKAGYVDANFMAMIPSGDSLSLEAAMHAIEGRASFESTPAGAAIWVDGVQTKYFTPSDVGLTEGPHDIKLVLGGYSDSIFQINVPSGETVDVKKTLISTAEGVLDISSTPAGASVVIDGAPTVYVTPARIPLSQGSHQITLKFKGYTDMQFSSAISPGAATTVSKNLVFNPTSFQVDISGGADPNSANVRRLQLVMLPASVYDIKDVVRVSWYTMYPKPELVVTEEGSPYELPVNLTTLVGPQTYMARAEDAYGHKAEAYYTLP